MATDTSAATVTGTLVERVEALGKMTIRGDISRWIADLDAAGEVRRAELIDSYEDRAFVDLVRLVDEYGGARVLEAVAGVGARLRRERCRLADRSES